MASYLAQSKSQSYYSDLQDSLESGLWASLKGPPIFHHPLICISLAIPVSWMLLNYIESFSSSRLLHAISAVYNTLSSDILYRSLSQLLWIFA